MTQQNSIPFLSGTEIRQKFLQYFEDKAHTRVKSAPLVPQGDGTLLFVNAGMVPFKDVFTGQEKRDYTRATSSQKCVRAGGKHNDLENVGRTARHHTFFEMLGNFSFGDYFKEEACRFAWKFLTEDLKIPANRLSVTVFGGEDGIEADTEAEDIWLNKIGLDASQVSRCGAKDNFWSMGDTGPCGPCTEIHFDRGDVEGTFGGDDPEGDKILEVWNLVFMQYERHKDGSMTNLPNPCVDTGMGLERVAMVLGGYGSNYDTDLLRPMISMIESSLNKKYTSTDSLDDVSMRVLADHARTTTFLIADGIQPSNEGRGYVLRRIMRRAIRHGARLGFEDIFFHTLCAKVVEIFKSAYPEVEKVALLLEKVAKKEEELFRRTLETGLQLFEQKVSKLEKNSTLDGQLVFDLKATYGFPSDLTQTLAEERGFSIDLKGFEAAEKEHALKSAGSLGVSKTSEIYKEIRLEHGPTTFVGYESSTSESKVISILKNQEKVNALKAEDIGKKDSIEIILDTTAFYGESGGEVGDKGQITGINHHLFARVYDTKKYAELHVHQVKLEEGEIRVGDLVNTSVNTDRLKAIRANHSATHILHKALRDVLGDHVAQKGSLVDEKRLRFDFSHFESMKQEEIQKVEDLVNAEIRANHSSDVNNCSFDEAQEKGAMALFGEKYGAEVRVVALGDSVELCGGQHVKRTGDIGLLAIVSESPLASGIRRIEAYTAQKAFDYYRENTLAIKSGAQLLNCKTSEMNNRIEKLQQEIKDKDKELLKIQQKAATASASEAMDQVKEVNGIKVFAQRVEHIEVKGMRDYADKLRDQLGSGVVVLSRSVGEDKATLLVALTKDLTKKMHAGKMVKELAEVIGGKGGGRPDFAQAGGTKVEMIDAALEKAYTLINL